MMKIKGNGNIQVGGNNIVSGNGTVNGKTYRGQNVSIINDEVFVDGQRVEGSDEGRIVRVVIEGDVSLVECDASVEVRGNVEGDVRAGGSVNCKAVGGDVHATSNVNCKAVVGSVRAGGNVNCKAVGGSVHAGGNVSHK